jgi:tetratricopeptide (TPR) repeat protein
MQTALRVSSVGLVLLLGALASSVRAQGPASEVYEQIYLDPVLKTGDLDTHAASLAKLIEQHELAALRRWQEIEDQVSNPRVVFAALSRLAKNEFKDCGRDADEFVEEYVKLAKRFTTDLAWQNVAKKWRGIVEASYVGPFAEPVAPAHDDAFSPEVMLDFAAEYDGAWGRIGWRPVRHYSELDADLNLGSQQRWSGYGYYVATAVVSEDERDAIIKLKFGGSGKVWLNGHYLMDADTRGQELPDEFELPVKLQRGRNILLVKLSTIGSLRIRLREPNGQPLQRVVTLAPKAGDKVIAILGGDPVFQDPPSPAKVARLDVQAELAQNAAEKTPYALVMLAYGQEEYERGLSIRSSIAYERAATSNEPLVQVQCLHWLERSRLISSSDQRKIMRATTDALLAADPTLVPAIFEKAKLLASDERWREAVDLLQGVFTHTPAKWRVYLVLADIYREAEWPVEQEAALKAALKEAPDSLPVLKAASDYYGGTGVLAREIELDRLRLAIVPGDPDVHLSLANTLGRTGDSEGAVKHLRVLTTADPANDFLLGRLAEALSANGNLTDALKTHDLLAERSATPEQELYQAARACLQLGREEQGTKYLERALQADPGHHVSRRELQRMRGESEDFWSAHALGWNEIMKHDVTRTQFPRAGSALVLDELIQYVYADGSSVNYVHTVRKILTQEGVDARGKDQINGELVTARTVNADGTVLEPITQPGGLIEFPGVKIGAYLDVAYIVRLDGGPLETLNGDAFFFMDMELDEPFCISRFMVIAPRAMPLSAVYHNLRPDDPGVTVKEETSGETVVRSWDVRNPRLPEAEQFMPSPLEIVPWIQFVQPRDWRVRAREVAAEGLRNIMRTPLIDARATELVKGVEGDEARARAIYAWVNSNFTTEGDAWNAHQALKAGAGDRMELFCSLCVAAGINLGFAAVDAAPPYKQPPQERLPRPHWAYPHDEDFGEFFVVVRGEQGLVYVNLDLRLRPFGEVSSRLFNAPAILWIDGKSGLTHLPGGDREKDRFENRVTIQLKEDGSATLAGSITIRGERSYAAKEDMRTASFDDLCTSLEADLAQQFSGFEVSECKFPKIGDVGEPLVQEYSGTVKRMGTKTTDGMTLELPGEKLGRLLSILVGARKREFDIALTFDLVQYDEIRITPPEGYAFRELPKDLLYPTAPLVYELKFRLEDGDLVVSRKLVLGPGRFKPGEYNDLVEQIKRIKQAEDSLLKLVK